MLDRDDIVRALLSEDPDRIEKALEPHCSGGYYPGELESLKEEVKVLRSCLAVLILHIPGIDKRCLAAQIDFVRRCK